MITYRVLLFASLKEKAGSEVWHWETPNPLTGQDLHRAFFEAHPDLQPLESVTRLAVNYNFSPLDKTLAGEDEIALIPPVSGG